MMSSDAPAPLGAETVRLRGHHLLCMLTWRGAGYTPAFSARFDQVTAAIAAGVEIEIVAGPDAVCAPVKRLPDAHCADPAITERDGHALREAARALGRPLRVGDRLRLSAEMRDALRAAFRSNTIRSACAACEWSQLCDGVAESGFDGARLDGAAP